MQKENKSNNFNFGTITPQNLIFDKNFIILPQNENSLLNLNIENLKKNSKLKSNSNSILNSNLNSSEFATKANSSIKFQIENEKKINKINYDNFNSNENFMPPKINSHSSKLFLIEYSKSKRFEEDKKIIEEMNKIKLESEKNNNKIIYEENSYIEKFNNENIQNFNNENIQNFKINENFNNNIQNNNFQINNQINNENYNENYNQNNNENIDFKDYKELLEYQEKNLLVPLNKKNDEIFKLCKMKKIKRDSVPPNKSVRKFGNIQSDYEYKFKTNKAYSTIKKKRLSHSTKKFYVSTIKYFDDKK
jgi:hypothetical protein